MGAVPADPPFRHAGCDSPCRPVADCRSGRFFSQRDLVRGLQALARARPAYRDFFSFQRLCDQGQSEGAARICVSTSRA